MSYFGNISPKISHPKDKYNLDEVVKVKILDIDRAADKPKISLSIKQAEQNPWDDVLSLAPEGKTLRGTVTRLADFGAFVEIAPGLETIYLRNELGEKSSPPKRHRCTWRYG